MSRKSETDQPGAEDLITKAVQAELAGFLSQYQDMRDMEGKPLVVPSGYLPQREIMAGIGPVDIKVPKTRGRSGEVFTLGQSRISSGKRA